jgi:hypothetical protein
MNVDDASFAEWMRATNKALVAPTMMSSIPASIMFDADVGAELIRRGAAVGYAGNSRVDWAQWHLLCCRQTPGLRLVAVDSKGGPPELEVKSTAAYRRARRTR